MYHIHQKLIKGIPDFGRWGCYVSVLFTFVARHRRICYNREEFVDIYNELVKSGFILHNDKPYDNSQGEWYRCFVAKPVEALNYLLAYFGLIMRIDRMERHTHPAGDFVAICYKTQWGYHFTLGNSRGQEIFNPDPDLLLKDVDSYRCFFLDSEVACQSCE